MIELRKVALISVLTAAAMGANVATSQPSQSLYSPVILGWDVHLGNPIQMHEDGGGLEPIALTGDLSHGGIAGGRYLLRAETDGSTFPDGSPYHDYAVYDEDGDPATRRSLVSDLSLARDWNPRWSVDGSLVLYYATRWDGPEKKEAESGYYVGRVVFDSGGAPLALASENLVVSAPPGQYASLSWDGQRIVLSDGWSLALAAFDIEDPGALPVPTVPIDVNAGKGKYGAVFSPQALDERILFVQREKSNALNIWVAEIPLGYDGSYGLSPFRVTTKSSGNMTGLATTPEWSPDAQHILYSASNFATGGYDVFKIRLDGRGKATRLAQTYYHANRWRR